MRKGPILFLSAAAFASLAFGQQSGLKGFTTVIPLHNPSNGSFNPLLNNVTPIPLWNYSVVGYDGKTYTGTIMGRSPYLRGKTTTTIPLQLIPLIIRIDNGGGDTFTYDPSVTDSCISPGSHTDVDVITGSPLLQNNNWTMDGINVGNTQYVDAFQRAEFWSLLGGSPYHLVFSPTILATQTLTFGANGTSGIGQNFQFGGCTPEGIVNINQMDAALQNLITGPLASLVNPGTFPVFLTRNVVESLSGDSVNDCCVLGYHGALQVGPNIQVYSPFVVDSNGVFGPGFTSTMSHELAEAINDPTGINPTPPWGNEGQTVGGCQANLEVGDPLSPGFSTPTNSFSLTESNGLLYSLQELAYFNWFYGGPSLGTGGLYSNNGTFTGFAKACPPGGTN
jgi:hypothetical protein